MSRRSGLPPALETDLRLHKHQMGMMGPLTGMGGGGGGGGGGFDFNALAMMANPQMAMMQEMFPDMKQLPPWMTALMGTKANFSSGGSRFGFQGPLSNGGGTQDLLAMQLFKMLRGGMQQDANPGRTTESADQPSDLARQGIIRAGPGGGRGMLRGVPMAF